MGAAGIVWNSTVAFLLGELLWVAVIPSAVAALILIVSRQLDVRLPVAWAASVSGGAIAGQLGIALRQGPDVTIRMLMHPSGAHEWLPWLILTTLGITVLAAYAPRSWQRWVFVLACLFALVLPVRLFAGGLPLRWSLPAKLLVVVLVAVVYMALWTSLALGRANHWPRLRAGLLFAVATGISISVTLSGSFIYGQLAGAVAAAVAGTLLADVLLTRIIECPTTSDGPSGAAGPLAVALGGLILLGAIYAHLPALATVLLGVALFISAGRLPIGWPTGPIGRAVLRTALCLLPLVLAIVIVVAENAGNPY